MRTHSSPMKQVTARNAAAGLRYLLGEVKVLTASLPTLQDAFDADDLPLAFILRRDSRPDAGAEPREALATRVNPVARRRTRAFGNRRRGRPLHKQPL